MIDTHAGRRFPSTFLRRHLTSGRVYNYARRVLLVGQFVTRSPDDADFGYFRQLPRSGSGLLVDVGANGGQSAVGFAICCPTFRILSFEPNPALWPELEFVRRIIGRRFEYRRFGLADREGEMDLHVPTVGRLPVTTRATLSAARAGHQADALSQEVERTAGIDIVRARFRRFDDLGLEPQAIKIDVEGAELAVLRGMRRTLAGVRPVLMLEANEQSDACRGLLSELGYRFFEYDRSQRILVPLEGTRRNWFALPAAS